MNSLKTIFVMALCIIVSACGGSDDEGSDNSSNSGTGVDTQVTIYASDASTMVTVGQRNVVSVKNRVEVSEQSSSYTLQEVTPLDHVSSSTCRVEEINKTNFVISSNQTGLCHYQYKVVSDANSQVSATAMSHVVVQPKGMPPADYSLQPIVKSMSLSECQTIDVSTGLPAGYSLNNETVTVGDGVSSANQPSDGFIEFCGETKGVTKVYYSASNDEGAVYWGAIDIAISVPNSNHHPEAANFSYYYDPATMTVKVPAETVVEVDVKDYIQDLDEGDQVQLIDVQSTNANVELLDKTNLDNTTFTFEASIPGSYYVSYMVFDHKGGYGVGSVSIQASGPFQDHYVDTGDINTSFNLSAPMIKGQYDYIGFAYDNVVTDSGYEMPVQSYPMAEAICESLGGALPTQAELELANSTGPSIDWPVTSQSYWVKSDDPEGSTALAWQLNSTTFEDTDRSSQIYFTCKNVTPREFKIRDPHYVIAGTYKDLIATYINSAGEKQPYSRGIRWESSDPSILELDENTGRAEGMVKGVVTVTATTTDGQFIDSLEVKVIDEIHVFGMGSLNVQTESGFNMAVERTLANKVVASNAMLQEPKNFGSQPDSKVKLKASWVFETAIDYDYNSLIEALNRDDPPAIVQIGYPNQPNAASTSALRDYLYDGGVLMYFSQYISPTQNIMDAVFGDSTQVGTAFGAGGIFEFVDVDDPVLNGPFGDLRGKFWGLDQSAVAYVYDLPAGQAVPFSYTYDVSRGYDAGGSVGSTGVTALRHQNLKFIWTGDAGFFGYYGYNHAWSEVQTTSFPMMVASYDPDDRSQGDYSPVDKPNYGAGTKLDVSNSTFFVNAVTWLFGAVPNE